MALSKMNSCIYDTNVCWCVNNLGRCDWKRGTDLMKTTHVHCTASDPKSSAPCRVQPIFSSEILLWSYRFMELCRGKKNPLQRVLQDWWLWDFLNYRVSQNSLPWPGKGLAIAAPGYYSQVLDSAIGNSVQNKQTKNFKPAASEAIFYPCPNSSSAEWNIMELYRNSSGRSKDVSVILGLFWFAGFFLFLSSFLLFFFFFFLNSTSGASHGTQWKKSLSSK